MQLMIAVAPDEFEVISYRPPDRLFDDMRLRAAESDRPFPGEK